MLFFRTDFTWNMFCKELCIEDTLLGTVTSRRLPQRLCMCHYTNTVSWEEFPKGRLAKDHLGLL